MKTKHPHITKAPALLLAILSIATGAAAAQTLFYADAGSGAPGGTISGSLDSIGFNTATLNSATGTEFTDTGSVSTRTGAGIATPPYYLNISAAGLPTTLGSAVLDTVRIYLFAESVNPDGSSLNFTIYNGLAGTGGAIVPLSLSNTNEGNFFFFDVTAAQFAGGISIGAPGLGPQGLLTVASEETPTAFQSPGLSATYSVIPEPSVGILGAIGALGLLRRRRA